MSDSNDSCQRELTLDEIQRDIDLFQERADPAVLAGYEARVLASQRNRRRTESKRAMLDEIQRLRRQRATGQPHGRPKT